MNSTYVGKCLAGNFCLLLSFESRLNLRMETNVVLTIDTEPSVAGALERTSQHKPLIHEPVAGIVDGQSEALGFIIKCLTEHELVATFFVETAHEAYFSNSPMERYVVELMNARQDVQLHLHPVWQSFDKNGVKTSSGVTDQCSELEVDVLTELMRDGCDLLEKWTGKVITGMRPGNYSTAKNVFTALSNAGIRYSSCISVASAPPDDPELQVVYGKHIFSGVSELPVTCFKDKGPIGRGGWRPMQVTSLSASEMIDILEKAHSAQHESVVIVTHPFEFLKRDNAQFHNLRINRMVQNRFKKLCFFLQQNRDRFCVVPLDLAAERSTQAVGHIDSIEGNSLLSLTRAISNFTNDRFI